MDSSSSFPPPGVETRLMITKIVCKDFKSYAGVKELGPFHKCFTSIVGPNGSGKSNVIDAMLFVFGYRARKIRSKKISILIHNSEHHLNLQSCSVGVHFQKIIDLPGDGFTAVPGSQFIVSRTAFKDNSSHYQLDGKKLPFKEIAALLRGSGIDLDHNRFLILQGEVEQIALMKPKAQSEHDDGMLEFLEDIVGTSRFKEPIEELAKRVEELNEARGEKLNRVKVVEREKQELEGAKSEAEQYLSLQRDVAGKKHTLYQKYIGECQQHEAKAAERKEELEAQVCQHQEDLNQHTLLKREKVKAQKKQLKAYDKQVEQDGQFKETLASCEQRDVRARQDLKNGKSSLKKASKALAKERERLAELEATPQKRSGEIEELGKKLVILEARRREEEDKLAEVMEGLKTATQGLQNEKETLELKLVDLNQTANEAKSKLDVARAELDIYQERFTSGRRQLEEAQHSLADITSSIKEKKREQSSLERSLPAKRSELASTVAELRQTEEETERLSAEVRTTRSQVEEARSSLQANRSRGQVLEGLMQQKASGKIPGIHGRLGDLGAIDEKYDVAISTACGALDNIVVDSMDTAVKCVEYLKKSNIGCATFIGLDKIERWRKEANGKISTPESVPRLFDLVRVKDDRFLTAFYFALRNTLVVSDLEQATRIGLQGRTRYRVVTLGGQLIDLAGTMSGGGVKVARGRMGSSLVGSEDVSPQRLQAMEGRLEKAVSEANALAGKKASLEEKVKVLQNEIGENEKQVKQLQRDGQLLVEQKKALGERILDLEARNAELKVDPTHLAKLEKQVSGFQAGYDTAAQAASLVQTEVKRLHDRIMQVGGARMQRQQAQVDAVAKEIDESNAAITKANVAIKTAERNTKKCAEKISSLEREVAETEGRMAEVRESLTALEEEARTAIDQQEQLRACIKQEEEGLQQLKREVERLEAEEVELQSRLVDVRHEMDKYAAKLKENATKIKYYQAEIGKLDVGVVEGAGFSPEQLAAVDKQAVEYEITMLEERLKQMTPNMAAIEEFKRKEQLHVERLAELDAITSERDGARGSFEDMRKQRLDQFMAGFSTITNKLKEMYQMITLGGDAELELVDSLDPFSEGIVFSVRPPKKSWKNISNLSGGEKTLSSLALVFALHHYKPSPLYVMDEIDAALDFKNVSIVANYIKERTKNAQFIIISLRNNMFELADRLVGIYKTDNCTKTVTIDPRKISEGIDSSQTGAPPLPPPPPAAVTMETAED